MQRKSFLKAVLILLCFFIIAIFICNYFIMKAVKEERIHTAVPQVHSVVPTPEIKVLPQNVVRKTHLDPNRVYYENIFFAEDKEIARFKNIGEKIYDQTGE